MAMNDPEDFISDHEDSPLKLNKYAASKTNSGSGCCSGDMLDQEFNEKMDSDHEEGNGTGSFDEGTSGSEYIPFSAKDDYLSSETEHFDVLHKRPQHKRGGTKRPKKKPGRPCFYCGKFQTRLPRHLELKHGIEERVKQAMAARGRAKTLRFCQLRKDGIYKHNMSLLKENKQFLIRERNQGSTSDLKLCQKCHGFFLRKSFHRHAKLCRENFDVGHVQGYDLKPLDEDCSLAFVDLLSRFMGDEVGNFCSRSNATVKTIAKALFEKHRRKKEKISEVRKAVGTKMRTIANLYYTFLGCTKGESLTLEDMFKRKYFGFLEEAVNNLSSYEDESLKAGLKICVGNLLKTSAKILKGSYLIMDQEDKASSIDKFLDVLHLRWTNLFGHAEYQIMQNWQIRLRRPERASGNAGKVRQARGMEYRESGEDPRIDIGAVYSADQNNEETIQSDGMECENSQFGSNANDDHITSDGSTHSSRRYKPKLNAKGSRTKGQRHRWSKCETEAVCSEFSSFIKNDGETNTGSLPGFQDIGKFLEKTNILPNMDDEKRVRLVHTKIFNERKKFRECFRQNIEKLVT